MSRRKSTSKERVVAKDNEEYNKGYTHTRSKSTKAPIIKDACFFCGKPPGNSGVHEAATFQVNERVHACAVLRT